MHNATKLAAHLRCRTLQHRAHCQKPSGQGSWTALAMTLVGLQGSFGAAPTTGRQAGRQCSTPIPQPEGASHRRDFAATLRSPANIQPWPVPQAAAAACQSTAGRAATGAAAGCSWRSLISRQFGTSNPGRLSGSGGGPPNDTDRLSERYGLKRSVRVTAMLGENGLVRGAGVVSAFSNDP